MKIAVGLSGGIDSAATALQLKKAGHDVMGITMSLFDHQTAEIESASEVADQLGITHTVLPLHDAFKKEVINAFIHAYEAGETPNPCLICNQKLKYGLLLDFARKHGAEKFATGHYAQIVYDSNLGEYAVERAVNTAKDQSYNLFHLTQEQLAQLILPLGKIVSKTELRRTYAAHDARKAEKRDSQGICFIEHGKQTHFLKAQQSRASEIGFFVDKYGKRLGRHLGTANYTIGQKRKLNPALSGRYVVTGINAIENQVILGEEKDLYQETLILTHFHFISPTAPEQMAVRIKTSQWSPFYDAELLRCGDDIVQLSFKTSVRAIAPGQGIVCYQGDRLIGGAIYHLP
ncbi:tRNA 2-thiouridine(34) synthase MnmA [Fusibacter paucivorans]|uniref:tRNA-specific 2-thiouridylase MnmA n=1 Tax=Fusibacter paucivorans TaxID=76009 RepID=A0ABS5PR17_9FIRM|nr:tRNA 2-thiouridine(34) synthase MnmA [Fusibacter paucivorans]MBS7527609.1 tRNA 2-thiouridine(34) synthase MnmA [Fusibacter paucivorans]